MTKQILGLSALLIATGAAACGGASRHATISPTMRNEVVAHYMRGESLDDIAREFRLDGRHDARDIVHDGMIALGKRYYQDR